MFYTLQLRSGSPKYPLNNNLVSSRSDLEVFLHCNNTVSKVTIEAAADNNYVGDLVPMISESNLGDTIREGSGLSLDATGVKS